MAVEKTARAYLEHALERELGKAKSLTDAADARGQSLTDVERKGLEEILSKAADYKSQIKLEVDAEDTRKLIEEMGAGLNQEGESAPATAKTIGAAFVQSKAYKAVKERGFRGNWGTGPIEVGEKVDSMTGVVSEVNTGEVGGSQFLPQRVAGVVAPVEYALRINDLLLQGETTQNSIMVVKETVTQIGSGSGFTPGELKTGEGQTKPGSYIEFDTVTVPVVKLATFLPVADEFLEDEAGLRDYIDGRMRTFVRRSEEDKLLNGSGGDFAGLLTNAGAAVAADVAGDNLFDAILAGIVSVRVDGGAEPDSCVMNATTWGKLQALKAISGAGGYFSGGPYATRANPWGLREVISESITTDEVLVGAFGTEAQVWRRGGLTLDASNSHADFFARNMTAIRAEERLTLAVYRDEAFVVCTAGS